MIKSKKVKKAIKAVTDTKLVEAHKTIRELQADHEMLKKEHEFEKREHKMTKAKLTKLEKAKAKKEQKKKK